ncbi:toll/interleukin-1 receptor-like protein [Eucalyptus grandis]|uniref:toll/interleukin-1 receptor-like protein n=1 Tax=Eucalyptus grandis TaxID=71139 RepID=UPI00192EE962|nr:toll/interleukin-1 receptor-like protein [Eucalyptus grandis]
MGNCVSAGSSSSANATAEELPVCHYHVFLSFRGPDVRRNFLDCFYDQLRSSGIVAFRDREEIKPGERINTKILEAIKHSDICIPVFSDDFASSAACLMEVAQMVESGKPIIPIFYGVKPSAVKHQNGKYGRAFIKHGRRRDAETIRKWKNALEYIAEILGFEVEHEDSG